MPTLNPFQSQMMLVAGMILMGWVLARRHIRSRKRIYLQDRDNDALQRRERQVDRPRGVPLGSAPPETQRWHAELLDLQRELKAELDTKIVVVQSLIRQCDERLARLDQNRDLP